MGKPDKNEKSTRFHIFRRTTSSLLYSLIKIMVRLALKIFCRSLVVSPRERLKAGGPLLITANHPNSFLDAIMIGAVFSEPVHFLTRGDVFRKPWHGKMLRLLQMIPIYRLSEGRENLSLNDEAFRKSREVLATNGILLIFIEGVCVNKHALQPFKKGAARIAVAAKEIPNMRVLPLGIGYDSFKRIGKKVIINISSPINVKTILPFGDDTKNMVYMNEVLYDQIDQLIEIPHRAQQRTNYFLLLPATLGDLLHRPLYAIIKNKIADKTRGTVFFDSVLFGTLLIAYPAYLLLLAAILTFCYVPATLVGAIILAHPLTAWCSVRRQ